jgi:hypothetical protein
MAYPFAQMPTWGEFIKAAKEKDCREGEAGELIGPRGSTLIRFLAAPEPSTVVAVLPSVAASARMTPNSYKSFQRLLGIRTGLVPELEADPDI